MTYSVFLAPEAKEDVSAVYDYIFTHDSAEKAGHVFQKILETCESLSHFPSRGHRPPELEKAGVRDFLQIHFKPYRIIYEVKGREVFVHCVLDGRRNLQELLEQRLLRP